MDAANQIASLIEEPDGTLWYPSGEGPKNIGRQVDARMEYGTILDNPKELPYVAERVEMWGRQIPLVPYFSAEANEWFGFLATPDGKLMRFRLVDVEGGLLLSARPLRPEQDLHLPLADLMFQRMSFPNLIRPLNGLLDCVENCASILDLYQVVTEKCVAESRGAQQLAQFLVNQLMVVSRSVYDVLHVFIRSACSTVKRLDDQSRQLMNPLPDRVSRMMLDNGKPRASAELVDRYAMPLPLAEFYCAKAPLLAQIRDMRDAVVHRGHNVGERGYVLNLEQGLAIPVMESPWRELAIWDDAELANGRLGSLRKVFAYLISEALSATKEFGEAFSSCVVLPDPISPGNHLFLRSPLHRHLMELAAVLASPWERAGGVK